MTTPQKPKKGPPKRVTSKAEKAQFEQIASLMIQGKTAAESVRIVTGDTRARNTTEKAHRITTRPDFLRIFYARLHETLARAGWAEDQVAAHWKAVSECHLLLFMRWDRVEHTRQVKTADNNVAEEAISHWGWVLRDDIDQLPADVLRCVQSVKMDDKTGLIRELKLKDSLKATELLARSFGMLIDRHVVESEDSIAALIRERTERMERMNMAAGSAPKGSTIN